MPDTGFALASIWAIYKDGVFGIPSTDSVFNPYHDEVLGLDVRGAASIRRENLFQYLSWFTDSPPILVVGEAPGPWGCRFTGVPYTSERLFSEGIFPFRGRKTSAKVEPCAERTATIFWRVMIAHLPRFVIWNTLPLHPHRAGEPLTIRPPTAGEMREYLPMMEAVMTAIRPETVLAVGRIAQNAIRKLDQRFIPIRHPSHGGAAEFQKGMESVLNFDTHR